MCLAGKMKDSSIEGYYIQQQYEYCANETCHTCLNQGKGYHLSLCDLLYENLSDEMNTNAHHIIWMEVHKDEEKERHEARLGLPARRVLGS